MVGYIRNKSIPIRKDRPRKADREEVVRIAKGQDLCITNCILVLVHLPWIKKNEQEPVTDKGKHSHFH